MPARARWNIGIRVMSLLGLFHSVKLPKVVRSSPEERVKHSVRENLALATDLVLVVEPDGAISRIEQPTRSGLKGFDDAPVDRSCAGFQTKIEIFRIVDLLDRLIIAPV